MFIAKYVICSKKNEQVKLRFFHLPVIISKVWTDQVLEQILWSWQENSGKK